ncbi:response regulator [Eubacterium sp.]|uniref:response regulator n=1 Tax=Eubacterium sp. TaxID=142586 RepID=UPI003F10BF47
MNILAIDDEKLALDTLSDELKAVFPMAQIHCFQKPSEALSFAKGVKESSQEISYAFLDIEMGGMNGLELAKELKMIYPNLILFFCTAYSKYAFNAFEICAKGYLQKPVTAKEIERVLDEMVTDWRKEALSKTEHSICVKTFGHFEVFVDGKPLSFEREKAKELFAYLVDRHGSSVTTEQISDILWEEAAYDRKLKNMTTAITASLKKTLKSAGIEDVLIKTWNHLAIDITKIKCDAYDFEKWDATAVNSFHGEYMVNYSWAEFTTGKYVNMEINKKAGR